MPEYTVLFPAVSVPGNPRGFTDKAGNELLSYRENVTPAEVIREFNLQKPRFAEMCRKGLFA